MAKIKGLIKTFLPFNSTVELKRNDKTLKLSPITQGKGSKGVFPGIALADFNLDTFKAWLPSNKDKDASIKLNAFICDAFNEVSQLVWRETVSAHDQTVDKNIPHDKRPVVSVTPEVYATLQNNFIEYLTAQLNGTRSTERDSKFFFNEYKRLVEAFKKETDPKLKAQFKTDAIMAKKTSDELKAAEDALREKEIEDSFSDILGESSEEEETEA